MNVISFLVSFGLFVGGIFLFAFAFQVPGFEAPIFFSGILACSAGVAVPIHVLKRVDG